MSLFKALVLSLALSLGLGMISQDAEALRLGGGRNFGMQRAMPPQRAMPAQAAPAQPTAPQPGVNQPNRWLGPLAGLAAGLGLGWLFAQGGMSGLGPVLLGLLVLAGGFLLINFMARQRQAAAQAQGGGAPLRYAGLGNETVAAPPPSQLPTGSWGGGKPALPTVPTDFDSTGFLKQAKLNFIRLQEANDRVDLQALREVTTDKLYEQLAADIRHRTGGVQHTDVVTLDAQMVEVVTEGDMHWASVRFSGLISETPGSEPVSFAEVWHLSKPVSGGSGWLVAGIQQLA